MKSLNSKNLSITGAVALFVLFTVLATSAHAVSFNFSYEWDTGGKVEGMLVGEIESDGNTVNVSELMATYVGGENSRGGPTPPIPIFSPRPSPTRTPFSGVATFDGNIISINAFDSTRSNISLLLTNNFTQVLANPGRNSFEAELGPFNADGWHLEQKQEVIPEPSTIILFGTGMLVLLAWGCRKKMSATS